LGKGEKRVKNWEKWKSEKERETENLVREKKAEREGKKRKTLCVTRNDD